VPHDQPVVAVETADGHRFELIDVAPSRPARTLVLLPGMGISARHYIAFAQRLAERGTRVFIHEWRGNGSSSLRAGKGRDWGYRELIQQDLAAAVRAASGHAGAPVWLAGHSLGSQLACLAAARHPKQAAGLLVIAGGAPYSPVFPWPMRLLLTVVFRAFPMMSGLVGHFPGKRLGFAGTEAHGVMVDWARTGQTGRYDLDTLDYDAEAALAGLALPVLTVRMEDDWFVPQASVDWLTAKLSGCRIDRRIVTRREQGARADHYHWLEAPAASAREVADWLSDPPTESPPGRRQDHS